MFLSAAYMKCFSWLCCLCLWLSVAWPIQAAVIPVTNLADSGPGSLRAAITAANDGDTIVVQVLGTIALDSQLYLVDTLTLLGLGPNQTIVSGQGQTRHFLIEDTAALYLFDCTLQAGNAVNDVPTRSGGSIRQRGYLEATRCVFRDNLATAGGAIYMQGSLGFAPRATIRACSFFDNRAELDPEILVDKSGGAILVDGLQGGDVELTVVNCTFSRNYADRRGGAILSNSRDEGRAVVQMRHCTITDNDARFFGGGIDNSEANTILATGCIVSGNRAVEGREDFYGTVNSGGGNLIGSGPLDFAPAVTDILLMDPVLGPLGMRSNGLWTHVPRCGSPVIDGAAPDSAPPTDMRGAARLGMPDIGAHERVPALDLAVNNLADDGPNSLREVMTLACPGDTLDLSELQGRISLRSPLRVIQPVALLGSPIPGLSVSGGDSVRLFEVEGGASLYAQDMTFRDGHPDNFGGGAFLNKGSLTLARCAIVRCEAEAGGGIANYGDLDTARLMLINCTLAGNRASDYAGGAIDNRGLTFGAYAELINCTVADNRSLFQGGGLFNDEGTFSRLALVNTIVTRNHAEAGPDGFGPVNSLGHNLIGNTESFGSSDWLSSDLTNVVAGLDVLARWDGPTPLHRLAANSPAVDAGDNAYATSTDQRGRPRIFNQTIDIGAYEYDPATRLADSETLGSLRLFPNPTRGRVNLLLPRPYTGPISWELFAPDGRNVLHCKLYVEAGRLRHPLDMQAWSLPAGIYTVQIRMLNERLSARLVIQ